MLKIVQLTLWQAVGETFLRGLYFRFGFDNCFTLLPFASSQVSRFFSVGTVPLHQAKSLLRTSSAFFGMVAGIVQNVVVLSGP
jgi:hypothetical protein